MTKKSRHHCNQQEKDCETCSLANYGRDCNNETIIPSNPARDENSPFWGFVEGDEGYDENAELPVWKAKTDDKKHNVNGWCDFCKSYCWSDCQI